MQSATPRALAELRVIAFHASPLSSPALTARPAHSGKYRSGITGASVIVLTALPRRTFKNFL